MVTREQATGNREQELREKRERVVQGLKCCADESGICRHLKCPYDSDRKQAYDCIQVLTDEAIALIDELTDECIYGKEKQV